VCRAQPKLEIGERAGKQPEPVAQDPVTEHGQDRRRPGRAKGTEHGRAVSSRRLASADLFGQGDDDAGGVAEVAEPEDALVLRHLAEEFGAVGAQAGDGVVDVVDGPLPSSSMPSSVKNATAASRSSTTTATLSIR
jgi:hypothetical protein